MTNIITFLKRFGPLAGILDRPNCLGWNSTSRSGSPARHYTKTARGDLGNGSPQMGSDRSGNPAGHPLRRWPHAIVRQGHGDPSRESPSHARVRPTRHHADSEHSPSTTWRSRCSIVWVGRAVFLPEDEAQEWSFRLWSRLGDRPRLPQKIHGRLTVRGVAHGRSHTAGREGHPRKEAGGEDGIRTHDRA